MRKGFKRAAAAAMMGAGFTLLVLTPTLGYRLVKGRTRRRRRSLSWKLNPWVRIRSDGMVFFSINKSDMGQGVFTSLPMIIAEELDADWAMVSVEPSSAGEEYEDPVFGMQLTGGSTSVMHMFEPLRRAGAAAREVLIRAAAETWGVDRKRCATRKGVVLDTETGATLAYGKLAERASTIPLPGNPPLKEPDRFTLIGRSLPRLDIPRKVHSTAVFGIDVSIPGMIYADVARPPAYGAEPISYDRGSAEQITGPGGVFPIRRGIAVTAGSITAVWKAKKALNVQWSKGSDPQLNSETLEARFRERLERDGKTASKKGDAASALSKAAGRVEATYKMPYLAHACMEPMNCTARVGKTQCDLWVPTQNQSGCIDAAAGITGLRPERIRVHTTFLGGGFGRRAEVDFVEEAVLISKETGRAVKLIWPREDDIKSDFFRPGNICMINGGLDETGKLVAWSHKTVCGPVWMSGMADGISPDAVDGILNRYEVPNVEIVYIDPGTVIPAGYWRSVGNSQNAFAVESFVDELAHAAGRDPLEFRLDLLKNAPAGRRVLEAAADKSGWGKATENGKTLGLAYHYCFGSHVANVAEISADSAKGTLKVHKVVSVVNCGLPVHPENIRAQIRGGVIMGLSAALMEKIRFDRGGVSSNNFKDYPILRMRDAPLVEVHILKSGEPMGGVGEVGLPPIAPAVANGFFRSTGVRLRALPLLEKM